MSKNLIPKIAKLLGVELEEAFKIRRPDYEVCENGIYAFFEGEGLMKKNKQVVDKWEVNNYGRHGRIWLRVLQ